MRGCRVDVVMWIGVALGCNLSIAEGADAQNVRPTRLRPATATHTEEFTQISGVSELADGRVVVGDLRETRLIVVDFATQSATAIGRQGSGPGEYRSVYSVFPVRGDTTLVTDSRAKRWLLLDGARIIATLPPDHPAIVASMGASRFAGARGEVAGMHVIPPGPGIHTMGMHDSAAIVLTAISSARADTVGYILRAPQTFVRWNDSEGTERVMASRAAFDVGEDFVVTPDGWIAIVRVGPYRVDWRAPGGALIRGAAIPYSPVRVTEREKRYYVDRNAARANRPFTMPATAPKELSGALEAGWRRPWTEFPEFVAPFEFLPLIPAPDGRVVVLRTPTADVAEPVYDVIDHRGMLVARIELAAGERIVGFGRRSVYLAAKDADDVERLRRHPWP